jgi:ribosomal subunit interface protein
VDIVVKGRNVEVPDHYRQHVADKLQKVERYDQKLIRVDVELFHERNPRQSDYCQRVEITCVSRGPVVRAEACAADFYSALDTAISKLEARLRRAADRRRHRTAGLRAGR